MRKKCSHEDDSQVISPGALFARLQIYEYVYRGLLMQIRRISSGVED